MSIIVKCTEIDDELGHVLKARIKSMVESDLHAADTRYHNVCKTKLFYQYSNKESNCHLDPVFLNLVDAMSANRTTLWNAVELQQEYERNEGTAITQRWDLIRMIIVISKMLW